MEADERPPDGDAAEGIDGPNGPDGRGTADGTGDPRAADDGDARDHLADVPDGCGCAEIWEHLSEGRDDG